MKLLSKCVPLRKEIETLPKKTSANGMEVYLLPKFLSQLRIEDSLDVVEEAVQFYDVVGLEVNEGIPEGYEELSGMRLINPVSRDAHVRKTSQKFLYKMARKFTEPLRISGKEGYFQFQAVGDPIQPEESPPKVKRDEMMKVLSGFVNNMKEDTGVEIMMENQNRICLCATSPGLIYNTQIGTKFGDFEELGFPVILDVSHLALDYYTIGEGVLYPKGVPTSKGNFLVDVDDSEKKFGQKLAELINANDKDGIRKEITDEIIKEMKEHKEIIGCVHFNNAGFTGVEVERSEGFVSLTEGSIDLERLLSDGITQIRPPYIVPEVDEVDYSNPVNQINVLKTIKEVCGI